MPNKYNESRRHHIPKMKFKVQNWREYNDGLCRRGSLTLWVSEEAISGWKAKRRLTPGGQSLYSDTAIETALMLRLVFRLPLRQTQGLMSSVFQLLGRDLTVPHYSTLSRRAEHLSSLPSAQRIAESSAHILIDSTGLKVYGAGEWLQEKHGIRARRTWRKLHLAINADTGEIVASIMTTHDVDDASQVDQLLRQIKTSISKVTADGERYDYGKRSRIETTMGRYKSMIGSRLRARKIEGQMTETQIAVKVLNRMLQSGRPDSVRISQTAI